jgi:hypothetical protein
VFVCEARHSLDSPPKLHFKSIVPMNVDFVMHRTGEWTMLMLGESVFSILIVDIPDEGTDFYVTFYCSVLTVVFLYYLHFQSQPNNPESHAIRRNKDASMFWFIFQQVYSLALVSLGAAFTFFLMSFANGGSLALEPEKQARFLAGGVEEDVHDQANILFCDSLAMVFFCLDVMTMLHLGFKESHERCICKQTNKVNVQAFLLLAFRAGLVVFTATMYMWEEDHRNLCIIALACVLTQLFLRRVGKKYASHNQVHALES